MVSDDEQAVAGELAGGIGRVMVVDDDAELLEVLGLMLAAQGWEVDSFGSASEALAALGVQTGRYGILLTDLRLRGEDGMDLVTAAQKLDSSMVCVVITGYASLSTALKCLRAGAFDFVAKPIDGKALELVMGRCAAHRRLKLQNRAYDARLQDKLAEQAAALQRSAQDLADSYQFMLESMVGLLEARERSTGLHSKRVTQISVLLAEAMGIRGEALEVIRRGACLHDIGKVAIPDCILLKAGPLDAAEWKVMQGHVEVGYRILSSAPFMAEVAELVYSHHEHYDGSGYPRGLAGADIVLGARIFAVVDAYDAMRSKRPYSDAQDNPAVLQEIRRCSGKQFDPQVVDVFMANAERIAALWQALAVDETPEAGGAKT